jgi:hypothetical protein
VYRLRGPPYSTCGLARVIPQLTTYKVLRYGGIPSPYDIIETMKVSIHNSNTKRTTSIDVGHESFVTTPVTQPKPLDRPDPYRNVQLVRRRLLR